MLRKLIFSGTYRFSAGRASHWGEPFLRAAWSAEWGVIAPSARRPPGSDRPGCDSPLDFPPYLKLYIRESMQALWLCFLRVSERPPVPPWAKTGLRHVT
jgi:hypothetical protein